MTFSGYNKTLDQFAYADSDINDIVYTCLTKTSFTGAAKDYSFSPDGEIDDNVMIDRVQGE